MVEFSNQGVCRFIPTVVRLRIPMLLAGLVAATLSSQPVRAAAPGVGQTSTGSATAAGQSASPGILHTPNTGNRGSTSPAPSARPRGSRNRSAGGAARQKGSSLPPAQDADSSVQVIGFPSAHVTGTADRPLLPIAGPGNALGIPSGTPIRVRLNATVDSGHAQNGQMVDGTLDAAIGNLPVGTPVRLTVVQSAAAGTISSYGQLSLQVVSIADRRILSNIITALGKQGAKELPDAAPARGTEAVFTPDQPISVPAA